MALPAIVWAIQRFKNGLRLPKCVPISWLKLGFLAVALVISRFCFKLRRGIPKSIPHKYMKNKHFWYDGMLIVMAAWAHANHPYFLRACGWLKDDARTALPIARKMFFL